jgi:hypothetical protein
MLNTIGKIITESLQDNATGRYSSSRVIAMLVAIASTVFMWKLILLGGMSIEYFIAYLAYGTGTVSLNKFLDSRDPARNEQAKIVNGNGFSARVTNVTVNANDNNDDLPRPPRNYKDDDKLPRPPRNT